MDPHVATLRKAARRAGQWWRSWRARFGLAEVCGTVAAVAGFAIGYRTGGSLLALVLIEAFLMCAFAAFIGLGLSWVAMKGIQKVVNLGGLQPVVLLFGIAIATLLALVSGLPPALRAKRLNIVDALAGR